jgi:DnaJ-class molecular chaperone
VDRIETNQMNEKVPAPCEPCHGSGVRDGTVCDKCGGKGYRLLVNQNPDPVPTQKPQQRQDKRQPQRRR